MQNRFQHRKLKNKESRPVSYEKGDFPPDDSYNDLLSLFQYVYEGVHQIILTMFIVISRKVHTKRR